MKNKRKFVAAVLVSMLALAVSTPLHTFAEGTASNTSTPSSVKTTSTAVTAGTLIPLRDVTDQLKAKIIWNSKTRTMIIQHGTTKVELTVGESTALVNGESVAMDGTVSMVKGKAYVPQTFINEVFAVQTTWNKQKNTVQVQEVSITALAEQFVSSLQAGEFDTARLKFNASLLPVVPVESLKAQWLGQRSFLGSVKQLKHSEVKQSALYDRVTLVYESEIPLIAYPTSEIQMTFQFDKNRKLNDFTLLNDTVTIPSKYQFTAYAKPSSYTQKDVIIGANSDWPLPATLTTPKGQGPFPVVVLVAGSGVNDREDSIGPYNKIFKDLTSGLASQGIATLSYDKRNLVYPQKFVASPATQKEEVVDDALAAVSWVRTQKGIDKNRIYIAGHSLGGLQAPNIVAGDKKIAGAILLGGPNSPADTVRFNLTRLYNEGIIPKAMLDGLEHDLALLADPSYDPYNPHTPSKHFSPGWMKSLHNYEPAKVVKNQTNPYLILQGGKDSNVPVFDFENWQKDLKDRPGVTYHLYDKLSHQFMEFDGEGFPTPAQMLEENHIPNYVINDIVTWVKSSKK